MKILMTENMTYVKKLSRNHNRVLFKHYTNLKITEKTNKQSKKIESRLVNRHCSSLPAKILITTPYYQYQIQITLYLKI